MKTFKIENVVFCETFRPEVGGKYTLLGASAPELTIAVLPAVISVSIWFSGTVSEAGPFEAEFRAFDVDKNAMLKATMKGAIAGTGVTSLAIGPMPLQIQKAGDYIFEWSVNGGKWGKIGKLRINYAAAVLATTPVPIA